MSDTATQSNFGIDISRLKTKPKPASSQTVAKVDEAAEKQGYVSREPKKKRGRPASPRKGQVHAWVMPDISDQIASEATRRGVTQGVLIEEAWALYLEKYG